MKAKLYKATGEVISVEPKGKYFTLEELQSFVGGYIELYPQKYENCLIVCDEEGLLKNKELNITFMNETGFGLVGDVLLCPIEIFEAPEEEE